MPSTELELETVMTLHFLSHSLSLLSLSLWPDLAHTHNRFSMTLALEHCCLERGEREGLLTLLCFNVSVSIFFLLFATNEIFKG